MKVQGYRTMFRRGQTDVSDSVAGVLSRLTPLFEGEGMRTLQPRPEMKITLDTNRSDINYVKITYNSQQDGAQAVADEWYYFAEFDPNSPATPGAAPYRLYVDWWAMLIDWRGSDPVGLNIKRGHLIRSHKFINATADQKRGTGIAIQPHEPRKLLSVQQFGTTTEQNTGVSIVCLYHVSGSIFSIPGTDKYIQTIVNIQPPTTDDNLTKQDIANAVSWLSNAGTVEYSVEYTDEQGNPQTYTESPTVSSCDGIWVLPRWVYSEILDKSPLSLNSATIKCQRQTSTGIIIPIGLDKTKIYSGYVIASDCSYKKTASIAGDLINFRYFGNQGANIVLPQTLEEITAEVLVTFSMAQNSFSVKFAAGGSVIDATNSFAINVMTENAQVAARNDIIKGGISAITAAVGAAVGGPAGFGAGLLLTGRGVANAAASGVGMSNYSRYSEGMNGIDNIEAIDFSAGINKYICGCALVTYNPDNVNEVSAEYNDHGAIGTMSIANLNRDTGHNYNFVQFSDDLEFINYGYPQDGINAVRDLLVRGVRIWNDTSITQFLGGTTWQSIS